MAEIRHIIDGVSGMVPRNWQELEIAFNWLEVKEEGSISTNALEFVLEAYRQINARIRNGLTGGVGIFEGIPYNIEVGQIGNPAFTFEGYIDGSADTTFIGREEIRATIKKVAGDDWLNDVADGFSFGYLYSIGEITDSDFKKVPYVINYVPDSLQLMILSMSLFMMTKELIENVKELAELIGQTVNASTPSLGVSVGFGGGAVTTWDLGDWLMYAAYVIAKLVYIVAIVIAIINLFEELIEQLFPKLRYHLGMLIQDLFRKGCAHLGLGFQSDLLTSEFMRDVIFIPQKDRKGGQSGERGFPGSSDPIYGFGDLIRVFKQVLNADYKIVDGVFRFERRDFWEQTSGFVIPDVFSNQDRLLNEWTPNTSEFVSNYNINWKYDTQDQNTLDDVTGLSYQAVTKPVTVINQKLVTMKGLTMIDIPFALGKRKDKYTALEEFAKDVFGVVDNLTGIFGGGTNFKQRVESRVGAMLLSSHFISVGKLVKMNGSKLANNQRELLGAKNFWDLFHYINSFALINGRHNQWMRSPEPVKIPITESEIAALLGNPYVTTSEGFKAMIESLLWRPYDGTATIMYRVNDKYTNNLKIEYVG